MPKTPIDQDIIITKPGCEDIKPSLFSKLVIQTTGLRLRYILFLHAFNVCNNIYQALYENSLAIQKPPAVIQVDTNIIILILS